MDIITFSEGLQTQIKEQAEALRDQEPMVQYAKMINITQEAIHDLQQFTYNYQFEDKQQEVKFFKEVKPVITSQYYYYEKLLSVSLYDSYKEPGSRKRYYESVLSKLEQYARKNREFFLYCMTGQTYLDDQYFVRKDKLFSAIIDKRFSTGYDDKLSRLLSHELLRKTILEMIGKVDNQTVIQSSVNWTGNKTDAIELLVALHASGNINHGEIEVKQFVSTFERCFNVKLDNYYDLLKKIRMRKGGRSNFIDLLRNKLIQRLDDMEQ